MIQQLQHIPAWCILLVMFLALLIAYYIRPDSVTEDGVKGVLGALLLSLRSTQPPVAPTP